MAGILVPLGFAPFSWFFMPIIGIAVLFYLWRFITPWRAFWRGWLFGVGMFGWGISWVHISMAEFAGVGLGIAWALTVLLIIYVSIFPAILGWLMVRMFPDCNRIRLLLASPAGWTLLEWIRSWLFTGFPWLSLGYSQIDSPLAGLAPFSGVYGVTWATAFTASLLVYAYLGGKQRALQHVVPAIIALWGLGWGLTTVEWSRSVGKPLQVAMVQGNKPEEFKLGADYTESILQRYLALSQPHRDADLIIWPETAIPLFYPEETALFLEEVEQERLYHGVNFMIGVREFDAVEERYHNSVLVLTGDQGIYRKNHLVPFGEYIPLRSLFGTLLEIFKMPMLADFTPGGTDQKPIKIGRHIVGISICYEDAFPSEVRRPMPHAAFLVNVSNDGWFGDSIAAKQHLQIARMRALENGRYLLRATNTGISAIINEKGQIVAQIPQFKIATARAEIQPLEGGTPYALSGNLQLFMIMFICLGIGFMLHHHWHPPDLYPPPPPPHPPAEG